MAPDLLIFGASARAAAHSAARAGFSVAGADLFEDTDFATCGPTRRVDNDPQGFIDAASRWPSVPWMYTGALENHPAVVEGISQSRTLWGNDAHTLRRIRNVERLQEAVTSASLAMPEIRINVHDVPRDGTWLQKTLRSAGGLHVKTWNDACGNRTLRRGDYFQRRVVGQPVAGVFVAGDGSSQLLGVSTQRLVDVDRGDFRYAGSSTFVADHDSIAEQFSQLGSAIAAAFQLKGLYGIDAVFDGKTVWPLEVNPRYTASVEIHERASGFHAVALHATACAETTLPYHRYAPPERHVAKAIYYAQYTTTVGRRFEDWATSRNAGRDWPTVVDVPRIGTRFSVGQPVTTLIVCGESADELDLRYAELVTELRRVAMDDATTNASCGRS